MGELAPHVRDEVEKQFPGYEVGVGIHGEIDLRPKGRTTEEQAAEVKKDLARRSALNPELTSRAETLQALESPAA